MKAVVRLNKNNAGAYGTYSTGQLRGSTSKFDYRNTGLRSPYSQIMNETLALRCVDQKMRKSGVYHAIRLALFENRGRFGVYNENHPDEFEKDNHPLIRLTTCQSE